MPYKSSTHTSMVCTLLSKRQPEKGLGSTIKLKWIEFPQHLFWFHRLVYHYKYQWRHFCRFLKTIERNRNIKSSKVPEIRSTPNFLDDFHFASLLFSMWKNHLNPGIFSPICVSAFYLIQNVTYLKWRFICQRFIHAVKQAWIKNFSSKYCQRYLKEYCST